MQETVEQDQTEESPAQSADAPAEDQPYDEPKRQWEYESGRQAAICLAGEATDYDRKFVLFLEVILSDESVTIDEMNGVTDESGRFTDQIDLNESPYDVKSKLLETISGIPPTELKDSKNFVNKCQQTLNQRETLSDLGDLLVDGDLEGVKTFIFEKVQDEIFPGSELNLTIKIGSNLSPETIEETDEDAQAEAQDADVPDEGDEESGPMFLDVVPEVNPSSGVPLRALGEGHEIEVRVVGDSVSELRDQFRCSDENSNQPRSKPLYSKLMEVESTGSSAETEFLVKITNEVYGRGTVDSNTMVELRSEEEIPSHIKLRRKILATLVGVLIFVFSTSLLVLLFPDSFFSLFSFL